MAPAVEGAAAAGVGARSQPDSAMTAAMIANVKRCGYMNSMPMR